MNLSHIKVISLFFLLLTIVQCQSQPKETGTPDNNNYKELVELIRNQDKISGGVSFVAAAAISTPCVVHIKTKMNVTVNYYNPFQGFFGYDLFNQPRTQKQESSGSGVIIASDGYIITNYHVIQNATEIEVTLRNKNTYKAKVVGTDKDSDLALIKIEEGGLPALQLANSDSVLVGEWVLAVGNPFNLESTVTQGIVSAKGRSLGNSKQQTSTSIESFIQTDAAVNPGNSGGALVNLKGELIGINTAIASPTGAYAGYAFAVPSNIVRKVMADLMKYGNVQRAYLGIEPTNLTQDISKKLSLPSPNGVLIKRVLPNTAAESAGLKANDVIVKIDESDVSSFPELLEHIATHSPGEKIAIVYYRNGTRFTADAVLKNRNNNTDILKLESNITSKLGIQVQPLSSQELAQYRVNSGIKVVKIQEGVIANNTQMKEGFIILTINGQEVRTTDDVNIILRDKSNERVEVEGFYPNRPYAFQYAFQLN